MSLAVLLAAASLVGYVPGKRLRVLREDGSPLAGAYAACSYSGRRFNLVDSASYRRAGRLVRSDAEGWLSLPGRLYLKGPLDGHAAPQLALLYVPTMHAARPLYLHSDQAREAADVRLSDERVLVRDLTGDPHGWERSIAELHGFLRYEVVGAFESHRPAIVAVDPSAARELAGALRGEVEALVRRHHDTHRQPPPSTPYFESRSPAERREIQERIRDDLAREPTWGPRVAREWRPRLAELEQRLAAVD